ncbi:pilus retraction protein PilT [Desulfobaculum xiamenense]|uniref:Pilus retraction protein PilT n=1 Tax=Desulfobaculum xiamenense TaxID=995050 RepID=A0A846QPY3_9BACT|nr:PilT/PilU family type 4a pilus ATPase [Desulfobaculum xiamenense]NJB68562.1 pilus retraction protein PilT [Desulfobaculum xiamenense]
MQRFRSLVVACLKDGITDMHITGGHPVVFRKHGQVFPQRKTAFSPEEVDTLVARLINPRQKETLRSRWSVDFAITEAGARLRINVFSTTRGLSMAIRFLPGTTPTIESLNLHPSLKDFCSLRSGLLLFCGATGSGKTTTIAAMLGEINRTRSAHIVTMEDPVEYRFRSGQSFIEQREHGLHFQSYGQGLIDVLRQAPDVIVVGELREAETMRLALNAAESGHLVISTLHSSTPEEAIYRICNSFPLEAQEFVRLQLSSCLAGVIVQHLTMLPSVGYRVPHLAILRGNDAVRTTIRENKFSQIENIMETGKRDGMFSLRRYEQEFLNTRAAFTPPSVSLRPSRDTAQEAEHRSALLDYDAGRPGFANTPSMPQFALRPATADDPQYVIDDSAPLDEIIQRITER